MYRVKTFQQKDVLSLLGCGFSEQLLYIYKNIHQYINKWDTLAYIYI